MSSKVFHEKHHLLTSFYIEWKLLVVPPCTSLGTVQVPNNAQCPGMQQVKFHLSFSIRKKYINLNKFVGWLTEKKKRIAVVFFLSCEVSSQSCLSSTGPENGLLKSGVSQYHGPMLRLFSGGYLFAVWEAISLNIPKPQLYSEDPVSTWETSGELLIKSQMN